MALMVKPNPAIDSATENQVQRVAVRPRGVVISRPTRTSDEWLKNK
jgi:hypothetical protein